MKKAYFVRTLMIVICLVTIGFIGSYYATDDTYQKDNHSMHIQKSNRVPLSNDNLPKTKESKFKRYRDRMTLKQSAVQALAQGLSTREKNTPSTEETSPADYAPSIVEMTKEAVRNSVIQKTFVEDAPMFLERILDEQNEDSLWTENVTRELYALLQSHISDLGHTDIERVNCYQTICRVVMVHGSHDDVRRFWGGASNSQTLTGPGHRFTKRNENGLLESTSYIARYGDDKEVDEKLYNMMYEALTLEKAADIVPTADQMDKVAMQMVAEEMHASE